MKKHERIAKKRAKANKLGYKRFVMRTVPRIERGRYFNMGPLTGHIAWTIKSRAQDLMELAQFESENSLLEMMRKHSIGSSPYTGGYVITAPIVVED